MPYIPMSERVSLETEIEALVEKMMDFPRMGTINYVFSTILNRIVQRTGGVNYSSIAGISGVLSNVASEFYRRVAMPYEDAKKEANGDIFP